MNERAIVRRPSIVMDVQDLVVSAAFWGRLLGVEPGQPRSNGDYLTVGPVAPGVALVLQRVDEPRRVKNRVHLDFTVDDVDEAVELILELGGRRLERQFTGSGETMADPDGNEFCIADYVRDTKGERVQSTA
ncbi:VOC family protein [Nesterenkonia ebinurensis]|uniref:VOC family protein n=1 Tax=Nesterenkonia ebinurensis TaxID=2608252 RepID=UPI00168BDBAF